MATPTYTWHGDHVIVMADAGEWRKIQDPIDREVFERELRRDAAEQSRTLAALADHGFLRNRFPFPHAQGWIQVGRGWVRRKRLGWEFFTGPEAVERLNAIVAPKPGAACLEDL